MDFDAACELTIGHEGNYVNDPKDPGGETKFGISKRTYPAEDIPNLTLSRAKFLYLRDTWGPCGASAVPGPLRFHLFDFAVNSGPRTAAIHLQRAVGAYPDGQIGSRTLSAINNYDLRETAVLLNTARWGFMTTLSNFEHNKNGWWKRIRKNIHLALT